MVAATNNRRTFNIMYLYYLQINIQKIKYSKIFRKYVRFVFKDSRLKTSAFIENNESFSLFSLHINDSLGFVLKCCLLLYMPV